MEKQKNIPQLRFPEFKEGWAKKKFGEEIKENGYGPRFNGEDYSIDGNVKTIRGTDISTDGEIKYEQVPLALLDESFIKNHILEDGDLVMITTADCGLTGVFRKQDIDYIPSAYAVKIKLKDSSSPDYFKYVFQTNIAKNQVNRFIRKATVANLPGSDILNFDFFLPLKNEQNKIASFLTAVDEKLQALKKKKSLLEQYKKCIMQKLFSQELRFKEDNGNNFPDWEQKKLGEVCDEHQLKNKNKETKEVFSVAKHKGVINQIEHLGRSFSAKEILHYKLIYPGDLVYTKSPTSDFPFGIIKQNRTGRLGVVSPLYCVFKPKTYALGYLLHEYFISSINTYNYLSPLVQKGAKNTMNINNYDFLNGAGFLLPMDETEQTKIANFLSAIDDKIKAMQQQIEKTEVWKKGLLQKMFV